MNAKRAGRAQKVARKGVATAKAATQFQGAKSKPAREEPFSYHPNDALAQAIVDAWTDPAFRDALLTFPGENSKAIWNEKNSAEYKEKIASTRRTLERVGVYLENPVVLTPMQYETYKKKYDDEVVFVLPDEPDSAEGKKSLHTAKVKMTFTVRGM